MSNPPGNPNLAGKTKKGGEIPQAVDAAHIERCLDTSDDFAFEMEVLHAVNQIEFHSNIRLEAAHGGTYLDPVTSLPRQFDLRVKASRSDLGQQMKHVVRLAIECKRLTDVAPLVVARSTRTLKERENHLIRSYYLDHGVTRAEVRPTLQSLYQSGDAVGRAITQIRSDKNRPEGDSEIYGKWSQALGSVSDMIWEGAKDAGGPATRISYSLPIACLVVPNGTLWAVDYDLKGGRSAPPAQLNEVEFFVGRQYRTENMKFTLSHLHIFTLGGLVSFLKARLFNLEFWLDHFPQT